MRIFVTLLIALITLASCQQNTIANAVSNPSTKAQTHIKAPVLTHLETDKEMEKIEGGTYEGFIGQDSSKYVTVKSFLMDETPVTNAEFLEFLKKNPQWTRSNVKALFADESYLHHWEGDFEIPSGVSPDAPVTNISWFAAKAYAESVGKRLPTIDEWEYAALADEKTKDASKNPEFIEYILEQYEKKGTYVNPVGMEKPNYYGLHDMYGMVWEWTEDFNAVMISGESRGDNSGNESLFCSGASMTTEDLTNYAAFIRYAMRGGLKANYSVNNLGFRCAKDI